MKSKKNLVNVSEGTGFAVEELTAVPSIGQRFTFLNSGDLADPDFFTSRGFDILSIKTSDIRFTYTLSEKGVVGVGYSTDTAVDFRNNQMFPKSDVVVVFRFKGNNIFVVNNRVKELYHEMHAEILGRFKAQAEKSMGGPAAEHIKNLLKRRLASGTCFMISELVVVERKTGACTWWKNKKADKLHKMVLHGYKPAVATRGYIEVVPGNANMWEDWAGSLWVNDCVCKLDKKENFVCAYRARQHK